MTEDDSLERDVQVAKRPTDGIQVSDLAIPRESLTHEIPPEAVFADQWPVDSPLLQRQLALELEGWLDGMTKYRLGVERAKQTGEARHLSPYRRLLSHWLEPLSEVIDAYRAPYRVENSGRAGGAVPGWVQRTAHLNVSDMAVKHPFSHSNRRATLAMGCRNACALS
jgi:hypothetical protein